VKDLLARLPKAIAGAVAGAAAAFATASLDGSLSTGELIVIAGAAVGAFGIVYGAPANATPEADAPSDYLDGSR